MLRLSRQLVHFFMFGNAWKPRVPHKTLFCSKVCSSIFNRRHQYPLIIREIELRDGADDLNQPFVL